MISIPPLLRILLPLVAGIVAGEVCFDVLDPLASKLWGAVVVFILIALWMQRSDAPKVDRWQYPMIFLAVASMGMLFAVSDRRATDHAWEEVATTHRAVVTESPRRTAKAWRARLRLVDAPHRDVVVEMLLVDSVRTLRVGQSLVFHARLHRPRNLGNPGEIDYAAYLRRAGVVGTGVAFFHDWQPLFHPLPLTLRERALVLRERWLNHYAQHFEPHDVALLSAITLGNRALLDAETRSLYSRTGTSHILALSGLHLAILYYFYQLMVGRLLLRCGRWQRWGRGAVAVMGFFWIWGFAFLVGFPTSLVRASLMFTLALAFEIFEHRATGFHRLQLAALVMLLFHPLWVFDLGFQLSCLAVAGILLLQPYIPLPKCLVYVSPKERYELGLYPLTPAQERRQRWGRAVYGMLTVSLAAQLATAPLVAYHFHLITWSGLLANLIVVPVVYLILGCAFLFLVLPFVREGLAMVLHGLLQGMETSLRWLLDLPFSSTTVYPSWRMVVVAYVGLVFWAWYFKRGEVGYFFAIHRNFRLRWGKYVWMGMVAVLAFEGAVLPDSSPALRVYNLSQGTHLHLILPHRQSLLLAADTLQTRQSLVRSAQQEWKEKRLQVDFQTLSDLRDEAGCERLQRTSVQRYQADTPLAFAPRIVMVGNLRCAVVNEKLSFAFPPQPLSVDLLLVGEQSTRSLTHILHFFHPRRVILSGGLSDFRAQRYHREAAAMGIPLFDVGEEGMFEVKW